MLMLGKMKVLRRIYLYHQPFPGLRSMMKHALPLFLLAFAPLFNSTSFGAVVLNGGFESGFTSWTTAGNSAIQGAMVGTPSIMPTEGASHALLSSGNGTPADLSITAAALETFLDLGAGGLTGIGAGAFRGSGLKQSLTSVNVGDVLTFSWNFLTNEATPSATNDFAFFNVSRVGGVPTSTLLANTNSTFSAITGGTFAEQTGYQPASFTFTVAGDYTLGFGVVNVNDQFGSSGLLVDGVSITAVPEPASLTALIGLGGAALTRRRRRNR